MRPIGAARAFLAIALAASVARAGEVPTTVDFNRDIRPILSVSCYPCHGPDPNKRKADLRLDTREGAFRDLGGYAAVVPGKPDESELYRRITAEDDLERMPPRTSAHPLSKAQVEILGRWIAQGADWKGHWSYIKPARPEVPTTGDDGFVKNAIDRFILAKLEERGMRPSPEADRVTLIRRLSFDLTGLPPTPEQVDAFVGDRSPDAYEALVDRLLASPHYGERMAACWLDLVRFADTTGYHGDNHRNVTLYRDYVIRAFNDDMPFDRFTVEQLAGDLLPGATDAQKVASGYNMLLMTTQEGGAQAKEYLAKYSADRVRNASTVWMGATLGCAECHDHKYDPFTTRDFYRFAAFFADLKERPVGAQEETAMPSLEQAARLRQLDEQIAALRRTLATPTPELDADQVAWEASLIADPKEAEKLPAKIARILNPESAERTDAAREELAAYYRSNVAPQLAATRDDLADRERRKAEVDRAIPRTLIATSVAPRVIRILPRGNWLDESGPSVTPAMPAFLAPAASEGRRATRLDLARWLVDRDNPLVARVFVNRLWKLAFGQGLVVTLDDFGAQGSRPTHPELLDWLATEFVDRGWEIKRMLRLMVLSGTYRQSSRADEPTRQRDPDNAWLARQSRSRLDAEMVRDNALAVSGLLVPAIGGPSVRPYQPAGYWSHLNFPRREYQSDHGDGLYRRGLYTYWCRTFLHPSLRAFDAPTREECTVERRRSNTPIQALVLLNDPTYVEAARALAERVLREAGPDAASRIDRASRLVLSRPARSEERSLLTALALKHREQYQADPKAVDELIRVGEHPAPPRVDPAELAAWTSVARVLLNLHESNTRN
jgi:hypothetical protein